MTAKLLPFLQASDVVSEAMRRSRWNRPRTSPLLFETKEVLRSRASSKGYCAWAKMVHEARMSGGKPKRVKRPKMNKPVPDAPVPRPAGSAPTRAVDAAPTGDAL